MLVWFVVMYLAVTVGIGLYASTRVKNAKDFAAGGRSMPFHIVAAMVFATWFGSEAVLGIPSTFIEEGFHGIVEDPFGSFTCLMLVGLFFARPLYRMNLLTMGDFFRQRYGSTVEVITSLAIMMSYLGWIAAQLTALGVVFNVLSDGSITTTQGMLIGAGIVLVYTLFGGMWSVALTDFFQMVIIVGGLLYLVWLFSGMAGGADKVIAKAAGEGKFTFITSTEPRDLVAFIGAAVTMMFGSIPQQDVFQRVMSAKDAKTAQRGAMIGGAGYILFAFVPMFIVTSAVVVMGQQAMDIARDDYQKLLPTYVLTQMPLLMQILFFGALVSAIKSTSSATLLAPSTSFVENILKNLRPGLSDRQQLLAMRWTIVVFAGLVLAYAIAMQGTPIYELVSSAYQVPLVGAFVPLVMGLYWKRATTQGAIFSVAAGLGTWILFFPQISTWGEFFPGQLAGLLAAFAGMLFGSLAPQWLQDRHEHKQHVAGLPDEASP